MDNLLFKKAFVAISLVAISVSGCKDSEPTLLEHTEALLVSSEWKKPIVTADGVDQSDLYQNFVIKFNKNTYTSSGGGPLWSLTGTWSFTDENARILNLDSKIEVQINEITESNLELVIQNNTTTFASGRVQSVTGKNIFKLKK